MTTFYKNYVVLCARRGVSLSAAAEAVGLSRTSPNGWKKGKNPNDSTLAKLADYFGVSVAALLGKEKEKPDDPKIVELIPGYFDLSEDNKEKALQFIAFLLAQQQSD